MKYLYASESKFFSVFRPLPCPLCWCLRLAADPLSGGCSWFQNFANLDILDYSKSLELRTPMENLDAFSVNLH